MNIAAFLFDLDGVIVDTAKYHYLAWKDLADELGIPFTRQDNERLKGVSRRRSFEIILELGNRTMSEKEIEFHCAKKNQMYLSYIEKLQADEVLPGVRRFLWEARQAGILIALGSASKNARRILDKLSLTDLFDQIIDGTVVSNAKPDPEVFLKGADALTVSADSCVVFEDSAAGITAALAGGMKAVGVGSPENLPGADLWISGFDSLSLPKLLAQLQH